MLKKIKEFHKLTKNKKSSFELENESKEVPVSFTHIYHKEYPRLPSKPLACNNNSNRELNKLLSLRKSTREFSERSLNLEQLSLVLESCKIISIDGEFERRTYPSAGARFPIEIYPVVFNMDGIERGVYHYNALRSSLETLWITDLRKQTSDIVSPYVKNPSAAFVMTSVIARSEIKYFYKSYPFSMLEAGHIGQNMYLACANVGIGCCAIGGFIDDELRKILDITEGEIPIYVIAIGNINDEERYSRKP